MSLLPLFNQLILSSLYKSINFFLKNKRLYFLQTFHGILYVALDVCHLCSKDGFTLLNTLALESDSGIHLYVSIKRRHI